MKISVITTVYNAEEHIEATIQSVLAQEGVEVEHIVTDGASTDGTVEIVQKYPQIQLFSEPDRFHY